jgi:predicted DNA-binding protein (UPF0251 family)
VANEPGGPDVPSHEPHPALDEDVLRAIEVTMHRLTPKEREFLRLYCYEDLPKEEIARRIGVEEERVRLVKHRSLKSFRETYERLKKISDKKWESGHVSVEARRDRGTRNGRGLRTAQTCARGLRRLRRLF